MATAFDSLRARFTALPPQVRRLLSAAVVVAAVVVVGGALQAEAPREVDLRVRMGDWGGGPVEVVRVSFVRGGEVLRVVELRPSGGSGGAPSTVHGRVSLPEGPVEAEVEVVGGGQVTAVRRGAVVRPGEALEILAAPRR